MKEVIITKIIIKQAENPYCLIFPYEVQIKIDNKTYSGFNITDKDIIELSVEELIKKYKMKIVSGKDVV